MSTQPVFPADMIVQILEQTARDCTRQWSNAHKEGHPERYDFIIAAVKRLDVASGGSVGGNWRRGVRGDLSMDGLSLAATDSRYHFVDAIIGAGGPNPRLIRANEIQLSDASLLRDSAGAYIHDAGFAKAKDLPPAVVGCGTVTPPIDPPIDPPKPPINPVERLPGRGEAMAFAQWLDAFYMAPEGLQRPNGASKDGRPDWEAVGAWMFDVWLKARVKGATEADARAQVVREIQQTDEWRSKHP